jgi:GNAT superfamily N-acetyltransferase
VAFQSEEGYDADAASLRATLAELLAAPSAGCVSLALEGGRAIGYAALCFGFSIEFRGRDAFVDEIYVVPERRGAGLGRALLRALEERARAGGVRQLHLEVERDNASARTLYLEEGFRATGRELLSKRLAR